MSWSMFVFEARKRRQEKVTVRQAVVQKTRSASVRQKRETPTIRHTKSIALPLLYLQLLALLLPNYKLLLASSGLQLAFPLLSA